MTTISQSAEIEFGIHISDHPVPTAERERLLAAPGFGAVFTDHMVTMRWSAERGWHDARLEPYGPLTLDPATREVWRGSRRITLTTREYALLEYFLRNPGRVLTRPMLAEHVWGLDFDPESNIVDVYVGYLRRKVDGPDDKRLIHTVRGAGYVLKIDEP